MTGVVFRCSVFCFLGPVTKNAPETFACNATRSCRAVCVFFGGPVSLSLVFALESSGHRGLEGIQNRDPRE